MKFLARLMLACFLAVGTAVFAAQVTAGQGTAQPVAAQPNLQPGANSPAESAAIAYMRTVLRSEYLYKQKHHQYAKTLADLVGSGSMTKRMARTDRGEYKVRYTSNGEKYDLVLVPATADDQHRSF